MGYYQSLIAAVLDSAGNQFVQRNEVLQFVKPIFISWSQPAAEGIQDGWEPLANGTLRAKYQLEDIVDRFEYSINPVSPNPNLRLFDYAQNYALGTHTVLFHLLLPPQFLPFKEAIKPIPTYARLVEERFLMGWTSESHEWFRFTFTTVDPDTFYKKAVELEQFVISGQNDYLETLEERSTLEEQLKIWQGNRQYLEVQEARYGGVLPLSMYNQLETTKRRIASLKARLSHS